MANYFHIAKVLQDPRVIEPMLSAALTVLNRMEGKLPSSGSIFDDILSAFKKHGFNDADAYDLTWDVMGLVTASGTSTAGKLEKFKCSPLANTIKVATAVLMGGAMVLDARMAGSGHLYSFPSNVKTNCRSGKPYHFWQTAFFAREMAKKEGNAEGAANAAWIVEKGYQQYSETTGRDPKRAFMVPTFDSANNKIRVDLAFAATGASFGASSVTANHKALDLDGALTEMVKSAKVLPTLTESEAASFNQNMVRMAEGAFRWDRIFNGEAGFKKLKGEAGL
jgi:hypothetical protein